MDKTKEYEMNDVQWAAIIEACRPVPYLIFGGMEPPSPQDNANRAWEALGKELGFDPMTVMPVPGKSQRIFRAVPTTQGELNLQQEA